MTILSKSMILVVALGLGACTDPGKFGGANGNGAVGVVDGTGVNNPNSPAYFRETVGDRVLFVVDQSTLTDTAKGILRAQANWLMANSEFTAVIEGHADEQGTREYNLALGARRANSVKEFLVTQGVSGSRLRVLTYGKERPIAVCSDESCYSQNRRAVTVIAAGGTS